MLYAFVLLVILIFANRLSDDTANCYFQVTGPPVASEATKPPDDAKTEAPLPENDAP